MNKYPNWKTVIEITIDGEKIIYDRPMPKYYFIPGYYLHDHYRYGIKAYPLTVSRFVGAIFENFFVMTRGRIIQKLYRYGFLDTPEGMFVRLRSDWRWNPRKTIRKRKAEK